MPFYILDFLPLTRWFNVTANIWPLLTHFIYHQVQSFDIQILIFNALVTKYHDKFIHVKNVICDDILTNREWTLSALQPFGTQAVYIPKQHRHQQRKHVNPIHHTTDRFCQQPLSLQGRVTVGIQQTNFTRRHFFKSLQDFTPTHPTMSGVLETVFPNNFELIPTWLLTIGISLLHRNTDTSTGWFPSHRPSLVPLVFLSVLNSNDI